MNDLRAAIRRLCRELLSSPKPQVIEFVSEIISLVRQCGSISAGVENESCLRFVVGESQVVRFELRCARGILRIMCARLAKLAFENGAGEFSPYEGHHDVRFEAGSRAPYTLRIDMVNTISEQRFCVRIPDER